MKSFFRKENIKELIKYIIFGVLTTLVSLLSFKLFDFLLGEKLYLVSNVLSWICSAAFAFVTNKVLVFGSKSRSAKVLLRESLSFAGARLFSLGVEELGLWLLVSAIGMGQMQPLQIFSVSINGNMIAKVIMQVVVVILNYVFSKFIIFKKRENSSEADS